MNVNLHQISEKSSRFEFSLAAKDLSKLEDRFAFDSMICTADLVRKQDAIQLHGSYTVVIETACDSCLEPVSIRMDQEFDLILVDEETYAVPESDVEISLQSEDVDFYKGQEIHLSECFEDQLLLDLPFSIKCVEDCEGICPECGANRNSESCHCSEKSRNNPFAVLGDLES